MQKKFHDAIIGYKGFLETGRRRKRSFPGVGEVECIEIGGADAVELLQELRKQLALTTEAAYTAQQFLPTADLLTTALPLKLLHKDSAVNQGIVHGRSEPSAKLRPCAEYVRAEVLDILGKALVRLQTAAPATNPEIRRSGKRNKGKRRRKARPKGQVTSQVTPKKVQAYELHKTGMPLREIRKALAEEHGEEGIPRSPTTISKWIAEAKAFLDPQARSVRARHQLPTDRRGQAEVAGT